MLFRGLVLLSVSLLLGTACVSPSAGAARTAPTPTSLPDRADAEPVDPRQLVGDPKGWMGYNVVIEGRALSVSQHADYTWIQLLAVVPGRRTTESIIVELHPKESAVLRDECYRLYGITAGSQKITRTLTGAAGEAPLVKGYSWEPC